MSAPIVKYSRKGNVHTIDFGIPAIDNIIIDYDKIPEEQRAGLAKSLLSAANLACYIATLGSALTARGANFTEIDGIANIDLGHNENKQARVTGINLDVKVAMDGEDDSIFERCQKIMKNGCLVTGSVHEGIHMTYKLEAEYDD